MADERLAALDVGDRRIGVAVSDASRTLAQPLGIFIHKGWVSDIQTLRRMLEPYGVNLLVLGDPLQEDGSPSAQSAKIHAFGGALSQSGFDIVYCDERETSQEAVALLRTAGGRARRGSIDAAAAALILQRYLDETRNNGYRN
ncbi:MAG: Holliday junction resolvase RuvX [Oscillospiraceae bacterium]|jgi:putative Holliday junction resolvase|nr:Holliday junction resolvase RuvX [Oscillospiraceae bacterium]